MRALIAARKSNKVEGKEGASLDTQDQYSQAFCERLGWTVAHTARDTISGRVAPLNRKDLGEWLSDPEKLDSFDVIVAYKTDRLSRGEAEDWSRIESWAADNGKTLVMVDGATGVRFPPRDDSDFWQWQAAKRQSGQEWNAIRERSVRAQRKIREDNGAVGRVPWGYVIAGDRYSKTVAPTPDGLKYVPEIFRRIADGDSLQEVANWLTSEKVAGKKWWAKSVSFIVRNASYRGEHNNGDGYTIATPALVDEDLFARANAKQDAKGTRDGGKAKAKALLTSVLFCPCCGGTSPMYRISSQTKHLDGSSYTIDYYRCAGAGAGRKGCGNMIRCDAADAAAMAVLGSLRAVVKTPRIIPATDNTIARAKIQSRMRELISEAGSADFSERMSSLNAELAAIPVDQSERTELISETYTYAAYVSALSPDEVGKWLRKRNVKMYGSKGPSALQAFTDAATAALVNGAGKEQFALRLAEKCNLAVMYTL